MIHLTVISVALWMMSAEFWEIGTSVWSTSVLLIVRFNDSSSPLRLINSLAVSPEKTRSSRKVSMIQVKTVGLVMVKLAIISGRLKRPG